MASVFYNEAKRAFAAGEIDWDTDDIRARLCMSNTNAGSVNDGVTAVSGITSDTCDDSNYGADKELANEVVTKVDASDRAELEADDISWTGLAGDSSRNAVGVLIYKFVTNDAGSTPICYSEFASPLAPAAGSINVNWNAAGIANMS